MILDLVEAVQTLQHALQAVRLGLTLPNESRMAIDAALATSEMATKSVLGEVRRIVELESQPKSEP